MLVENQAINEFNPSLNVQVKIHPFRVDKYERKYYILFLPTAEAGKVNLSFIAGIKRAAAFIAGKNDENLTEIVREIVREFFFSEKLKHSFYSKEQIEVVWRWFAANKEFANYLDISRFSGVDACTEAIVNYLNDSDLFSSHIWYVES
ncbi:MAG: hypothetical protein GXO74_09050 [Calditrichaeota bacterium]|nr:hypothetical protein [Calditrichota bacterium]